jgi:hypothetical protein
MCFDFGTHAHVSERLAGGFKEAYLFVSKIEGGTGLLGLALTQGELVQDVVLDTLALRERHERGGSLADDEHVVTAGGEGVSGSILDVNDVEATRVLLTVLEHADATQVTATSDHHLVSGLVADLIHDLASLEVDLDGVVQVDGRVRVADGAAVVGDQVGDALQAKLRAANLAQLVLHKE